MYRAVVQDIYPKDFEGISLGTFLDNGILEWPSQKSALKNCLKINTSNPQICIIPIKELQFSSGISYWQIRYVQKRHGGAH